MILMHRELEDREQKKGSIKMGVGGRRLGRGSKIEDHVILIREDA